MIVPANFAKPTNLPDSDGQPMADNTLQFEWITTLKWGCETLFADRKDVFVAGDHLIYPVEPKEKPESERDEEGEEGEEEKVIRFAPDVYVVFGRPKGHRGSYRVWEESGIFPQVIFEVWSPGNRFQQMEEKRKAYEEYGAEEYYIVYPEQPASVDAWVREEGKFIAVSDIKTWVSPRLGIRFETRKGILNVVLPDGTKMLTYSEMHQKLTTEQLLARQEAELAEREAKRAEQEARRADSAEQRAAKLAAKLREVGLDPDAT